MLWSAFPNSYFLATGKLKDYSRAVRKKQKKPSELAYEYSDKPLEESKASKDPLKQFHRWFREALAADVPMPHAMGLSTAKGRRPESRIVLLKDYGPEGFLFFTNYRSAKGNQLKTNPHAALLFYWPQIERQIRISGKIKKAPARISDEYFRSRPHGYQVSAHVSGQSRMIPQRRVLETRYAELKDKYRGRKVPRPPHWGGYLLLPEKFEFWQGRSNRLHDRLQYRKSRGSKWTLERLAP